AGRALAAYAPFLLRRPDELLHAIRAPIARQSRACRLSGLRRRGQALYARAQERKQESQQENEQERKQEREPLHRCDGLWPRCRRLLPRWAHAAPLPSSRSIQPQLSSVASQARRPKDCKSLDDPRST